MNAHYLPAISIAAFAVSTVLLPGIASAAVVVSSSFQNNGTTSLPHTYSVSSTDLLNGLAPSASVGDFSLESTGGLPILTDGAFSSPLTRGASGPFQFGSFATGGNNAGTSVTYTLATMASIASIDVYGGWQDGGRDQQSYSVFYALASAPSTFILLQTVNFNPAGIPGGSPVATKTTISEDATGILASNVQALRFDFNTTENGYSGYSEIDVLAVPEPSAALLSGVGLLGYLIRRRR